MKTLKHDLSDLSFLIPVRIDSDERKSNLIAVITFLSDNFISHIHVLEADSEQKFDPNEIDAEFSYHFITDTDEIYYKTRYVNILLNLAKTKLAAVWDADIIAYPELVVNGICRLRKEESFLVIPYDGRVHAVDALLSTIFRQSMEINVLKDNTALLQLAYGYYSTGGAYIVNRRTYLDNGGENENFYGWGPEDMERVKRMDVLGLNVHYEKGGGLFHLWHPRRYNSWFANKETELRNRKEFLHTCKSDRESLLQYLKSNQGNRCKRYSVTH
ncbi:MAG: hypothetical protein IH591_06650 [Bacteroidales bacterium]|nr:hypothetical protein [Bacteroidales bacterium]